MPSTVNTCAILATTPKSNAELEDRVIAKLTVRNVGLSRKYFSGFHVKIILTFRSRMITFRTRVSLHRVWCWPSITIPRYLMFRSFVRYLYWRLRSDRVRIYYFVLWILMSSMNERVTSSHWLEMYVHPVWFETLNLKPWTVRCYWPHIYE